MIYFKSILAGCVAVFAFAVLAGAGFLAWQYWSIYRLTQQADAAGSNWSFNSPWISIWWVGTAALLIFAAGFYWQFRRASRR
jgi:hypothetical protein